MYLHLGSDTVVKTQDIVGIFDLDNCTVSVGSRRFLTHAEKKGQVINVTSDLPKTFVISAKSKKDDPEGNESKIYICQISSATLRKRTSFIADISNI